MSVIEQNPEIVVAPRWQHTLQSAVSLSGIGVHLGCEVDVQLIPAPPNTGIIFCRTDVSPVVMIPAHASYIGHTSLASTLVNNAVSISTVEHLLSACAGMCVDNLYVHVNGPEIPICDGSAKVFVEEIQRVGLHRQLVQRRYLKILKPIHVSERDYWVSLVPYEGTRYTLSVSFDHPMIAEQTYIYTSYCDSYMLDIAPARTFAFMKDIFHLWRNGQALGGDLKNVNLFAEDRLMNPDGLRFDNEVVRHKMLDVVGDLMQLGCPIIGEFRGFGSSHYLNNLLARQVLSDSSAWCVEYL